MRGSRRSGTLRAAGALCAALALARPAAAHDADPFAGETPVADAELELRRGGFEIGGFKFDLKISVRDTVNGYEIQHAVLQLANGRREGQFELAKVSHVIAQGPLPASPDSAPALTQTAEPLPAPELAAPVAPLEGQVHEKGGLLSPALDASEPGAGYLLAPAPEFGDGGEAAVVTPPAQTTPESHGATTALSGNMLDNPSLFFALINTASGVSIQRDVQLEITLGSGGSLGSAMQSVFSQASSALREGQLGAVQP